jgi:hypothetical protein
VSVVDKAAGWSVALKSAELTMTGLFLSIGESSPLTSQAEPTFEQRPGRHLFRARAYSEDGRPAGGGRAIGHTIEAFVVMGGGAASDLWCQIVADVSGRPAHRAGSQEATSLGAAILAMWGTGMYPDLPTATHAMTTSGPSSEPGSHQARYERLYSEVYQGLYEAVRSRMDGLAASMHEGNRQTALAPGPVL